MIRAALNTRAVDEEGRGSLDTALNASEQILLDLRCISVVRHVLFEAVDVEVESCSVLEQVLIVKGALMLEEVVVHLPEFALVRRGLGRFSGALRMRVDFAQWEVSVDKAKLVTQLALQSPDDMVGETTVRAFVIGVLDQRHRGCVRSLNVVRGIDRHLEVTGLKVVGQGAMLPHDSLSSFPVLQGVGPLERSAIPTSQTSPDVVRALEEVEDHLVGGG